MKQLTILLAFTFLYSSGPVEAATAAQVRQRIVNGRRLIKATREALSFAVGIGAGIGSFTAAIRYGGLDPTTAGGVAGVANFAAHELTGSVLRGLTPRSWSEKHEGPTLVNLSPRKLPENIAGGVVAGAMGVLTVSVLSQYAGVVSMLVGKAASYVAAEDVIKRPTVTEGDYERWLDAQVDRVRATATRENLPKK